MDALFYTNWPVRPGAAGFRARTGWWDDNRHITELNERLPRSPPRVLEKAGWTLHETLKFAWAANESAASQSADKDDVVLLADADVIFQCTADELRRRIPSFRTPLVVGTELNWFPKTKGRSAGDALDPFKAGCRAPLRYPNSGGVVGTRQGLATLMSAVQRLPTFPCCSSWDVAAECHVLGQACMQAALLTLRLANWPVCSRHDEHVCDRAEAAIAAGAGVSWRCAAPPGALRRHRLPIATSTIREVRGNDSVSRVHVERTGGAAADYSLDVLGRIFLNTYFITARDLKVNDRGQLVYNGYAGHARTRTGEATVPCIIHSNGFKRLDLFRELLPKWTAVTYVPTNATPLQRALIRLGRGGSQSSATMGLHARQNVLPSEDSAQARDQLAGQLRPEDGQSSAEARRHVGQHGK